MPNIFIDPVLVVAPSEQASKTEVENWFNSLDLWLKEATTPFYEWFYSVAAINSIIQIGLYPSFNTLRILAKRHGIDVNIPIITNRLKELLNNTNQELKTQDFDQRLEALNYDVEFQPDSTQIAPPEFTLRWPEKLQPEMLNLFGKLCVYRHTEDEFITNLTVATSPLRQTQDKQIEVATIVKVAIGAEKLEQLAENSQLKEIFPLLFTPDDLSSNELFILHVLDLWAQGEAGIRKAINQHQQKNQKDTPIIFNSQLGNEFIKSFEINGLHHNSKVLNTLIRVMTLVLTNKAKDVNGLELRHYKESKNSDKQLIRNGAGAWRLTLTTDGAGWRLHFWRKGDTVEFSNVVKESPDKAEIFGPYFL